MRTTICLLVLAGSAHAGVYFGDGSTHLPRLDRLRSDILQLRAAAAAPAGPLDPDSKRARFQTLARTLERAQQEGPFSTADRVSLSACYIYLGRTPEAIRLLHRGDATHHLVLANLATAHFLGGEYDLAARYQAQLLRAWPAVTPHWSVNDLVRFRTAELAFDRLINHRALEARRGTNRDLPLDPIFPGFTVETADGDYEPGVIPAPARDRLPADAAVTLLQLLLWMPADMRLYWQLGELMAGLGQVEVGAGILQELVDAGQQQFKGVFRHRRVLKEAAEAYRLLLKPSATATLLQSTGLLIARSAPPPGASGHVLAASALTAPLTLRYFKGSDDPAIPAVQVEDTPTPLKPFFNWQHLLVSFAFGFLAAALILFQLQEWQRRAARTPPAEEQSVDGGHSGPSAPPAGN